MLPAISEIKIEYEIDYNTKKIIIQKTRMSEQRIIELEQEIEMLREKLAVKEDSVKEMNDQISELVKFRNSIFKDAQKLVELNNNLADSEKQLEAMVATKDKFFSIIAHDLKNPLTIFLLDLDLLHENFESLTENEIKKSIKAMHSAANKLHALLENLLEWSKVQTGRIPFQPDIIDLSYIAQANINLLMASAEKKKINLFSAIKKNTYVFVDSNMITTIFRNLITNAIKFTPEEGIIRISAREEGEFIQVSIKDTGIGISPNDIDKLFRIDIQHTTIGTNQEKGTGLGLILCREFAEKNGGRIWVTSKEGKGSSFNFLLPQKPTQ